MSIFSTHTSRGTALSTIFTRVLLVLHDLGTANAHQILKVLHEEDVQVSPEVLEDLLLVASNARVLTRTDGLKYISGPVLQRYFIRHGLVGRPVE